jgi:hypothetical protein
LVYAWVRNRRWNLVANSAVSRVSRERPKRTSGKGSKGRKRSRRSGRILLAAERPPHFSGVYLRLGAVVLGILATVLLALGSYGALRGFRPGYGLRGSVYLGFVAGAVAVATVCVAADIGDAARRLSRLTRQVAEDFGQLLREGTRELLGLPRWQLGLLFAVWVVGGVARASGLRLPMRYDEAYTYSYYARWPLVVSLGSFDAPNNHLFHTALAHLSVSVFGSAEWAVRLPAYIVGVVLAPCTFFVGRLFLGRGAAMLASAVTAVWPLLVDYSANARGYTLIVLLFAIGLGAGLRWLRRPSVGDEALLAGVTTAMLYTTPAAVYAVGALWFWLMVSVVTSRIRAERQAFLAERGAISKGLGRLFRVLALAATATALLYGYPFAVGGFGIVASREDIRPLPLREYFDGLLPSLKSAASLVVTRVPGLLVAILLVAIGLALADRIRIARSNVGGLVLSPTSGLVASLALTAFQRQLPYARVWIFVVPILALEGARGIERACKIVGSRLGSEWRRGSDVVLSVAATALGLAFTFGPVSSAAVASSTSDPGVAPGARSAAERLAGVVTDTDMVIAKVPADAPLIYYFLRRGLSIDVFANYDFKRVLAYVAPDQTITDVVVAKKLPEKAASDAVLLETWEQGSIYAIPGSSVRGRNSGSTEGSFAEHSGNSNQTLQP